MSVKRGLWLLLGVIALGLGVIGVVLPLLPTTPFILVAAFAFARSSERLHHWLVTHKQFGPLIADWNAHGAISKRTKVVACISIASVFMISVALKVAPIVLIIQAIILSGVTFFIVTRPLPPAGKTTDDIRQG